MICLKESMMKEYLDITQVNCRAVLENMLLNDELILLQKIEDKPVKIIKTDEKEGSHTTYNIKIINPESGYAYKGGNFLSYHIKERGNIIFSGMIVKFKEKPMYGISLFNIFLKLHKDDNIFTGKQIKPWVNRLLIAKKFQPIVDDFSILTYLDEENKIIYIDMKKALEVTEQKRKKTFYDNRKVFYKNNGYALLDMAQKPKDKKLFMSYVSTRYERVVKR
jgi:hypothetical protein